MSIALNAYRINKKETTVFISFSNIKDENFKLFETAIIKNSKEECGVIFHIKHPSKEPTELGNDTVSFKADFEINTDIIRVFYWIDEDLIANNIKCFQDFLEKNGLDPNALEDLGCQKLTIKSKNIPRQSGNGGVIGITNLP